MYAIKGCVVLDYDSQWADVPGYHFYDFNAPEGVPAALHHEFDMVWVTLCLVYFRGVFRCSLDSASLVLVLHFFDVS